MTQVEENKAVVHRWMYEMWAERNWDLVPELVGPEYVRHESDGTRVVTAEQYRDQLRENVGEQGPDGYAQVDMFGEGDKVVVIWSVESPAPVSSVQVYRVADGKLVETWYSRIVQGYAWRWDRTVSAADVSPADSKAVLQRWYGEVYEKRQIELVPELAGPTFRRHEFDQPRRGVSAEFEMTSAEYQNTLEAFIPEGGLSVEYEVIAADDKVAVIASAVIGSGRVHYVQAWRVAGGKFVESWFAGVTRRGVEW